MAKKIVSRIEAANSGQFHVTEIETHAFQKINREGIAGIELIIDRQDAFKKRRDPMACIGLTLEAAKELRDQLDEALAQAATGK